MYERPMFKRGADAFLRFAERKVGYKRAFVIRSHHFDSFIDVHNGPLTPEEKSRYSRMVIARSERPGYATDVLGETAETADHFEASKREFLEQFQKLPDDHPVKIVNGQMDGICNGCAHANHCSQNDHLLGDVEYFHNRIIRTAKSLGIADQIKIQKEYVRTSDNGVRDTFAAHTTAGVMRKILDVVAKPSGFASLW